jgi:hypothetical protein
MHGYLSNETTSASSSSSSGTAPLAQIKKFFAEFDQIYDELSNDLMNGSLFSMTSLNSTSSKPKWTVYLWDNKKLIDYVSSVMSFDDYNLQQKLDKILSTIKNHIVRFHHVTQSIVSNNLELESMAKLRLRLSTLTVENVKKKRNNREELLFNFSYLFIVYLFYLNNNNCKCVVSERSSLSTVKS